MSTRVWKESDIGKLVYDPEEDKLKVGSTSGWTDVGLSSGGGGDVTEEELYSASGTIISTVDTQIYITSGVLDTLIDGVQTEMVDASGYLQGQITAGVTETLLASGDIITQLYSASGTITAIMATDTEVEAVSGYLQGQIAGGGVTEELLNSASGDIVTQLYNASGTLRADIGGGTADLPASGDFQHLLVSGTLVTGFSPSGWPVGFTEYGARYIMLKAYVTIPSGYMLVWTMADGTCNIADADNWFANGVAIDAAASGEFTRVVLQGYTPILYDGEVAPEWGSHVKCCRTAAKAGYACVETSVNNAPGRSIMGSVMSIVELLPEHKYWCYVNPNFVL